MRALFILLALFVPRVANADKSVGLIVAGEALKGLTQTQAERWLRAHDRTVVTNPLPADAVKTLFDCFLLDDAKCSRGVVDARATTANLITIRLDVVSKKDKDVRLTVDWFVKGRNPITARRTCEDCTEAVLHTTIDALLLDLSKSSPGFMGRIKVDSDPPGITVMLDNQAIGVTPVERDVAAGKHKARLVRDGRMGAEKDVTIEAGALSEVKLETPPAGGMIETPPNGRRSRVAPITTMILGGAAIATGAVFYFAIHKEPGVNDYDYKDWKTPGLITAGAGVAVLAAGAIWFVATKSDSGPTVGATTTGDATIGWTGRF